MTRMSRLAASIAVLALLAVPGAVAAEPVATYAPPYEMGPEGGDAFNFIHADPDEGRIFAGRAYPLFFALWCDGGAGFSKFEVHHTVTEPITTIAAELADAAVDNYTFVTLAVQGADGEWLASARARGPLLDGGTIEAPLFAESPEVGEVITIQFGLEIGSACPHVNGGTVRFPQVTVQ